ncbi:MAG: L-fucose/L-arabinose isomerase family protein, partial [Chloroflexota bacterium]
MALTEGMTLGFIAIARTTFDVPLAENVTAIAREHLQKMGFTLVGPDALVTNMDEAQAAAVDMVGDPPDMVILFQATFADSTMVMHIATEIDAPLLLWAVPEARTGGRLRLNSLCGINLAGHALTRAGIHYEYVYGEPDDAAALEKVTQVAAAARAYWALRGARIGSIGEHPAGFDTCDYDVEIIADRFGVEVVSIPLQGEFFPMAQKSSQKDANVAFEALRERVDGLDAVDDDSAKGTLRVYAAMQKLSTDEEFDGLAVRCWPEFFTELGCAACGAMSMMTDNGVPCSCEADVNGTITQMALQALSGEPAFGADVVAVDDERDGLVIWHCGLAPLSMADPEVRPQAALHSNRKLPLLMEFPLKPGRVTVARFSEATGSYRLVIGSAEMLRAPKSFSGTSGVLKFDRPAAAILDTILSEGLEHHISLTYGDHTIALMTLAKMLELPVL